MIKLILEKVNNYIVLFIMVTLFLIICTSCTKTEEGSKNEPSSYELYITKAFEEQTLNTTEAISENEENNYIKDLRIVEKIPNKVVFAKKYKSNNSDATTIFVIDNKANVKFYYNITDKPFDINNLNKYVSILEGLDDETIINRLKKDRLRYYYSLLLNVNQKGPKIIESSVTKEIYGQEQLIGYILDSNGDYEEIILSSADEFEIEYLDINAKEICTWLENEFLGSDRKNYHIRRDNYTKHIDKNEIVNEISNKIVFLKIFMFYGLNRCYKIFLIDNEGNVKYYDNIPNEFFDDVWSANFDNRDIILKLGELGEGVIIDIVDKNLLDYYHSLLFKIDSSNYVMSAYANASNYEKYLGYMLDEEGKYIPILLSDNGYISHENWDNSNIKEIDAWLKNVLPEIPGAPFYTILR